MSRCERCGFDIAEGNLYCGKCGRALRSNAELATRTIGEPSARASSTTSVSSDEGRFPAGTVLAQRYRIVNLLGRGGMGEVYRATDLLLGQPVALKFLPPILAHDEGAASRLRNEVKTARQVTHPNVCRVHDIGEHDGQLYLSMEFVDGEDLASLLRRIGRLPEDKGLEIARKLCAGLAAAHEKGVIHRDLKPANVMIDGRGQVIITDFGLAGFSEGIKDVWSGTPAYMSPEQKAGREVTARSDIYSLGLVLHELFTGKKSTATSTTSDVLDPAIGQVIEACLQEDPQKRPASPLLVARALPGSDPLAAALAAGETPSPELVAASGEHAGLRPAWAVALAAVVISGLLFKAWFTQRNAIDQAIPTKAPESLVHQAQELVDKWAAGAQPANEIYGLSLDEDYLKDLDRLLRSGQATARDCLWTPHTFWYRSGPVPHGSLRITTDTRMSADDPPLTTPGMVLVILDARGRLREFKTVPLTEARDVGSGPPEWAPLLTAAGLERDRLTPLRSPQSLNPVWTYQGREGLRYRVEAESYEGQVRRFAVQREQAQVAEGSSSWIILTISVLAVLFAIRNYRRGRADIHGSLTLAITVFLLIGARQLLVAADPLHWSRRVGLVEIFAGPVLAALVYAGAYMAVEPFVRRRWPQVLVTWTRFLRGEWHDAAAGRDLLVGLAGYVVTTAALGILAVWNLAPPSFLIDTHEHLVGARHVLGFLLLMPAAAIERSVMSLFLIFVLRLILRRDWLAGVAATLLFTFIILSLWNWYDPPVIVAALVIAGINFIVLIRYGFLATVAKEVGVLAGFVVATLDPAAWFAGYSFLAMAAVMALTLFAFRSSLGGQKLLNEEI